MPTLLWKRPLPMTLPMPAPEIRLSLGEFWFPFVSVVEAPT